MGSEGRGIPSVRVGRWVLRQGGPLYFGAVIILTVLLCGGAATIMPHTLLLAAVLLRLQCGAWLPLVLLGALFPVTVLHEATHVAVFALARLPVRIRLHLRRLAILTEVPVAVPRRVALVSALAPQPVVLGALTALMRTVPAEWPLWFLLAVLSVAGSAGDFLSAGALAISRDKAVVTR